jgi:phosphate transport system permease protein
MSVEAPLRTRSDFPQDDEFRTQLRTRRRKAGISSAIFLSVLIVAVAALATLLYTIGNEAFGLVAIVNQQEPEAVVATAGFDPDEITLEDMEKDDLVAVLVANVSTNVGRRLEREQRFYEDRLVFEPEDSWNELCQSDSPAPGCSAGERDGSSVYQIVLERVVVPDVVASYKLVESSTDRARIEAEVADRFPDARLEFRAWLTRQFVMSPQSATPEVAGVRTAIFGTLWVIAITILFAVPVGVGAAIYLEEYARPTRLNRLIQTNINNLAGVPSIIYGMLGLAVLVRTLEPLTSGALFSPDGQGVSENGRTILAAGLTLGLLILPIIIISAQEALRAVPGSLRQAGMALGATKWQTTRSQVLPVALPGILTGAILAVARAIGETAPLIVVGASTFINVDPSGPFSKFTVLPIQIYQWTARPQDEFRSIAAAAIIVLLVLLLTLNATAVILRNRYSRRAV